MKKLLTALVFTLGLVSSVAATETVKLTASPSATGEVLGATSGGSVATWVIWGVVVAGLMGVSAIFFFSRRNAS